MRVALYRALNMYQMFLFLIVNIFYVSHDVNSLNLAGRARPNVHYVLILPVQIYVNSFMSFAKTTFGLAKFRSA